MSKARSRKKIKTNTLPSSSWDHSGSDEDLPHRQSSNRTLSSLTAIQAEHGRLQGERIQELQGLPPATRAAIQAMAGDTEFDVYTSFDFQDQAWEDVDEEIDLSHEGGEFHEAIRAALPKRRQQPRSERIKHLQENWDRQMSKLIPAFLAWKAGSKSSTAETGDIPAGMDAFEVVAVDTHDRRVIIVQQGEEEPANVSLIKLGYLGCAPVQPQVAVSLRTLELYHRLRRRHPQLSIQAMMRAICDLQNVNYHRCYQEQMTIAFDAYLQILRGVHDQVNHALGRDKPQWRIKNACPCCTYKLDAESDLQPAMLAQLDGNNSLKRVASAATADGRVFSSDYMLTQQYVNHFKDEVKHKSRPARSNDGDDSGREGTDEEDAPWVSSDEPGDVTDGEEKPTQCTERWKASAAEYKKRALDVYEQTGIFASACRHGMILAICEMVHSGELAKYPLAVVDFLLDTHGKDIAIGYDIGCAFKTTIANSALVGPKARALNLQVCVNAFHGWQHNRLCQLSNHPLYLEHMGIEDFEGMERIFSSSNNVARGIRYASRYHYAQAIDIHFTQWDEDKYAEITKFLSDNYHQALSIIDEYKLVKLHHGQTEIPFEDWLAAERTLLSTLKNEPEERILECAYIQALQKAEAAQKKWDSVAGGTSFRTIPASDNFDYDNMAKETRRVERVRRAAMEQRLVTSQAVEHLEHVLDIEERWTPTHTRYKKAQDYLLHREFHKALNKVQQLVIQRLLELEKANLSGTGYKARVHISKAIKTRGQAIRTALKTYNLLAAKLDPPAATLEWKHIVNYAFISEFDILRHSRSHQDIRTEPWILPANRELTNLYYKYRGAANEIERLNIEIRRLYTSIQDEQEDFLTTINRARSDDPLLAAEISEVFSARQRLNDRHLRRLEVLAKLPGFTGSLTRGQRIGRETRTGATFIEHLQPSTAHARAEELSTSGAVQGILDIEEDGINEEMTKVDEWLEHSVV